MRELWDSSEATAREEVVKAGVTINAVDMAGVPGGGATLACRVHAQRDDRAALPPHSRFRLRRTGVRHANGQSHP